MLILFPVTAYLLVNGFSRDVLFPNKHAACFTGFLGLVLGTIYCTCDWIFFLPVHFAIYNFASEFLYLIIQEIVIPIVICYFLLLFLFKEPVSYKLKVSAYMLFGFYAVQSPYFTITRYETLSPFLLLIKPIMQLGLCTAVYCLFSIICTNGKKNFAAVLAVPSLLVMLVLPAVIETMWFLGADAQLWATGSIIYTVLAYIVSPILARSSMHQPAEEDF